MNKIIIGSLAAGALLFSVTGMALAAGADYKNFRSVMGEKAPMVTEQNFGRFTEMHKLMAEGDYAGAQKIREELGMGGRGNGKGCAMKNGQGKVMGGCRGGASFVDENKNGICDHREAVK